MSAAICVFAKEGTKLRTAVRKKAEAPSPVGLTAVPDGSAGLAAVLASLEDSKAENIVPIDIRGKSSLGDHLVIASGRSNRHVAAIAEHLVKALKDGGFGMARIEGLPAADWVLIDASDIIVHVFRPEVREFYALEKMWLTADSGANVLH